MPSITMQSETRVQAVGRRLLAAIPRRPSFHWATKKGAQDMLMRQTMQSPELAKAMFGLVADSADIHSAVDLKLAKAVHFDGLEAEKPFLMRVGLDWMPAALFYPFFRWSVDSMAQRFIAGNSIDEALDNVEALLGRGVQSTLDVLGESVTTMYEANENIRQYAKVIVAAYWRFKNFPGFQPNISVKLTGVYPEAGLMRENQAEIEDQLGKILDVAMPFHAFVRLDTEYYKLLALTNDVYRSVLSYERYSKYSHQGIVQQLYLKEAELIAKEWIDFSIWRFRKYGVPTSFRLVKGAYVESEARAAELGGYENPVCGSKALTDINYEHIAAMHLKAIRDHGPIMRLAFGTHNPRTLSAAFAAAQEYRIPIELLESQVLFGMDDLVLGAQSLGIRIREYLPAVTDRNPERGLPYYSRRLKENTANGSMMTLMDAYRRGELSADEILINPYDLL